MNALTTIRSSVLGRSGASEEDEQTLVGQALSTALAPFRVATSRPAIKLYLSTLLFVVTSTILLSISTTAYLLFYYNYIPQIGFERPLYLQYAAGAYPSAEVPLPTNVLISQQSYDVDIILHMPRTPSNIAAGNFMLDMALTTELETPASPLSYIMPNSSFFTSKTALQRSRRSAILPYTSRLTSLSHTLLHLPFHLLSLRDLDSSTITVPMFEEVSFPRGRINVPTHAHVEIQSQYPLKKNELDGASTAIQLLPSSPSPQVGTLQIYSAKVVFHARFHGLRYIIYNYRVVSFLLFTTLFYTFSIATMATVWAAITAWLSTSRISDLDKKNIKLETGNAKPIGSGTATSQGAIKAEADDSGSKQRLYDIKAEDDIDGEMDSSDAAAEARAGALITDHHLDAEDEEEDEEELEPEVTLPRRDEVEIKNEDDGADRIIDSGIGTSMESEVAGSNSGLVRRRSGRGSDRGSRPSSRIGRL